MRVFRIIVDMGIESEETLEQVTKKVTEAVKSVATSVGKVSKEPIVNIY